MDAWFEEDEQVFTHPRDPYTRVDILPSSRHVRVEVDGVTIAETTKPTLLFETGLPVALLPAEDGRAHGPADARPTPSATARTRARPSTGRCASATASSADVAWSYRTPLPESQKIAGLISFYPEKVDLYVDGVRLA